MRTMRPMSSIGAAVLFGFSQLSAQVSFETTEIADGVYQFRWESHSDADHSTGATALLDAMGQASAPIIAHEKAVAPIRARASADQPLPTMAFARRMTFQVGGRPVELHYLGPSHTDNMIVPFLPDVGVAFAVDFVSNDVVGFRDLPGWQFPDFFDAMSALLRLPFDTIVFGHGPAGDRASVLRQIAYYDDLTAVVRVVPPQCARCVPVAVLGGPVADR